MERAFQVQGYVTCTCYQEYIVDVTQWMHSFDDLYLHVFNVLVKVVTYTCTYYVYCRSEGKQCAICMEVVTEKLVMNERRFAILRKLRLCHNYHNMHS